MYEDYIGEKNGVPYLKALSEAWRCEFYRYSIRQDTFQIIGQNTVYDPQTMTTEDWLALLCLMWEDFKNSLTIIQEFEFNQNKVISKVIDCKPLGHKQKAALPARSQATEQIACQSLCKYFHYKDAPNDMTKQSILQGFQKMAPRLTLTDATIALVTRRVTADTKFK
jgi:hypothetical protein